MRLPDFRKDLAAIKPQPGDEAQPFTHFLRMETPKFTPAPPDTAMRFDPQPLANPDKNAVDVDRCGFARRRWRAHSG